MKSAVCKITGMKFEISEMEYEYCRREGIPLPDISPLEKLRYLCNFRNRLHLYNGVCALSKKKGLTAIPPESNFTVYDVDVWDSDDWDPLSYGRDYDFSRPFFDQMAELLSVVPIPNLSVQRSSMENSDFTNGITGAKNCYLVFSSSFNEDCMYSRLLYKCKDIHDTVLARGSELCYGSKNINNCFAVFCCENCYNCTESSFLANCQSCKNCFGCVNLNGAEYCFFNEQLTREQYQKTIASIDLGSHKVLSDFKKQFAEFRKDRPIRFLEGLRNEESSGAFLNNTKNCNGCYSVSEGEDLENCLYVNSAKSSISWFGYGNGSELVYSSCTVGDHSYNVKFCVECWPGVRDLEYCYYLSRGSDNCFGCVGIRKQSYCILNKKYSAGDYKDLVSRIKKHMLSTGEYGQLFPISLTPHYYNKSEANDFFPESKERIIQLGYRWREDEKQDSGPTQSMPDNVNEVTESMLNIPFVCEHTGKRFKILPLELKFHQRMKIALPRIAPLERLKMGADFLSVKPVLDKNCAGCGAALKTTHAAQVLCESCYQQHVTG